MVLVGNGGASHGRVGGEPDGVHACDGAYRIPVVALLTARTQYLDLSNPGAFLVSDAPCCSFPGAAAIDLLDTCHWDLGSGGIWLLHHGTLCFSATVEPQ